MQDIAHLATFNKDLGELADAAIYIKSNVIEWVGLSSEIPDCYASADYTFYLTDHVVVPGLVNTHHHMFQCISRCVAQVSCFPSCQFATSCWQPETKQMLNEQAN